jgi:hypothetical protein
MMREKEGERKREKERSCESKLRFQFKVKARNSTKWRSEYLREFSRNRPRTSRRIWSDGKFEKHSSTKQGAHRSSLPRGAISHWKYMKGGTCCLSSEVINIRQLL